MVENLLYANIKEEEISTIRELEGDLRYTFDIFQKKEKIIFQFQPACPSQLNKYYISKRI